MNNNFYYGLVVIVIKVLDVTMNKFMRQTFGRGLTLKSSD